jgi:hypothetical protein
VDQLHEPIQGVSSTCMFHRDYWKQNEEMHARVGSTQWLLGLFFPNLLLRAGRYLLSNVRVSRRMGCQCLVRGNPDQPLTTVLRPRHFQQQTVRFVPGSCAAAVYYYNFVQRVFHSNAFPPKVLCFCLVENLYSQFHHVLPTTGWILRAHSCMQSCLRSLWVGRVSAYHRLAPLFVRARFAPPRSGRGGKSAALFGLAPHARA